MDYKYSFKADTTYVHGPQEATVL